METEWNSLSGIVQGDIAYSFRTISLSNQFVDFSLIAYSDKWNKFDISFEYKTKQEQEWRSDAFISISNANKIFGNKIVNLDASKYGSINVIRWDYSKNSVTYGENLDIQIIILPRIRQFSTSQKSHIVSQIYSKNFASIDVISKNLKILNVNNDGHYICAENGKIHIKSNINEESIFSSSIFSQPNHAIQLNNRNYLISDIGSSTIFEMNENLTTIVRNYSISDVSFFDYHESNETILLTRKNQNLIQEYTWGTNGHGQLIWNSSSVISLSLNSPESSSYKIGDCNNLVIADMGTNRIILFDKTYNTIKYIDKFYFYEEESSDVEILNFYNPFRVFWLEDTIYIVEKEGRILTFETMMSSSSSSSSSSSLEYSSSSSSLDSSSSSSSRGTSSSSSLDSSSSSSSRGTSSSSSGDSSSSSSLGTSSSSSS